MKIEEGYVPSTFSTAPEDLEDYVKWEQSLGNTWGYRKFPGGMIVQWGQETQIGDEHITVKLPVKFESKIYAINVTPHFDKNCKFISSVNEIFGSLSQFEIYTYDISGKSGDGAYMFCTAIGY